jgi:hypothetical protein
MIIIIIPYGELNWEQKSGSRIRDSGTVLTAIRHVPTNRAGYSRFPVQDLHSLSIVT